MQKKPSESRKAKGLWARKAASDRSEEYYDPVRKKDFFVGDKNPCGTVGRTLQRPAGGTGESTGMSGESPTGVDIGFHSLSLPTFVVATASSIVGAKILLKMWEGPC